MDDQSRCTAHEVVRFVQAMQPRFFVVENVWQIRKWGPLDESDRPIKAREGEFFDAWVESLLAIGYHLNQDQCLQPHLPGRIPPRWQVGWGQLLSAADFGAPTSRVRWFLLGHRERTVQIENPGMPHRPFAECIDWSLPMRRVGPQLCANTIRRIEAGRAQFGERPFVCAYYGSEDGADSVELPLRTITTRDRFVLVRGPMYRMIEPEEYLLAQGFPRDYWLAGNRGDRNKQVGNSVSPEVAHGIVRQAA